MLLQPLTWNGPTVQPLSIGSASLAAAVLARVFSDPTMPTTGGRPRSTRSTLETTKVCSAGVIDANPLGNVIGPTPSSARALSIAATIASVQACDDTPWLAQTGQ